jgi:mannose-6-phosphate isomerase-like protein (cupin superfamily)
MVDIHTDTTTYTADRAWGARAIAEIAGATVRLHWTDKPYIWHTNDGSEVFMVIDGHVDMHYRQDGTEHCVRLNPNDIFVATLGDEHVAHPLGAARILVIEEKGSV